MTFIPKDPNFEQRVRASFDLQTVNQTLGCELLSVGPGTCVIRLPHNPALCQQHGYLHAGITTTIADTAAGYAAYSLMPPNSEVVSVEFKINLMAPAVGEVFEARAKVDRPGRSLTVVRSEVVAITDGKETTVALMQATMICLPGAADKTA
ncbi:MAG: PaaI family thioesterase [Rhodospirillum sp.]|nr:PaaI family thioesterase [Rhodospirillum sp.]MCF8489049.1 PaaI family thioesterase [Rhodospirillum sp.]MCF8499762.1 PaaI family thioesterase [Rhodospirillum sp.]